MSVAILLDSVRGSSLETRFVPDRTLSPVLRMAMAPRSIDFTWTVRGDALRKADSVNTVWEAIVGRAVSEEANDFCRLYGLCQSFFAQDRQQSDVRRRRGDSRQLLV